MIFAILKESVIGVINLLGNLNSSAKATFSFLGDQGFKESAKLLLGFKQLGTQIREFSETDLKGIIDSYNKLKTSTENITDVINGASFDQQWLKDYLSSLKGAPATIEGITAAANGAKVAQEGMAVASTKAAAGVAALRAAVTSIAIMVLVQGITYLIQRQEELRKKAEESARATNEQIKSLDSLKAHYDEIINSTKDETDKTKDLDAWKKTLIETYGFERKAIEGINLEREKTLDLLDKEILAAKKRAVEEGIAGMGNQYDKSKAAFETPKVVSGGLSIDYSEITGISQDVIDSLKEYNLEIAKADTLQGTLTYSYKLNVEGLEQQKASLAGAYTALKEKQDKTEAEINLMEFLKSEYDAVTKVYDKWIDTYSEGTKLMAQKALIDAFESGKIAAVDSQEAYNKLSDELILLAGSSEKLKQAIIDELAAQFPQFANATSDASDKVNNLGGSTDNLTSKINSLIYNMFVRWYEIKYMR